jgi:hypothetical protein
MKLWSSRQSSCVVPAAAAVLLLTLPGCDGPRPATAPTPVPSPPAAAPAYHASGVVTDETGAPMGGALVSIAFAPYGTAGAGVATPTNGAGQYQLDFSPGGPLGYLPNASGTITAYSPGFQVNQQSLAWGATDVVKNLRLRAVKGVEAGQSLTVSIDADDSICSDQEDWFIPQSRCEQFTVRPGSVGTLMIEARAVTDGGPVPIVFSATSGWYRRQTGGPGTVSLLEVRAGESYQIYVGVPDGTAPQRFAVSTSLRADGQ